MVFYLNKIGDYQVYTLAQNAFFANFIARLIVDNIMSFFETAPRINTVFLHSRVGFTNKSS